MAVIKMKPTSPGQRAVVKVSRDHLHKGEPYAPLLEKKFQKAGRNNNGHITVRHKGGGHKHHYRVVDFVRNKDGVDDAVVVLVAAALVPGGDVAVVVAAGLLDLRLEQRRVGLALVQVVARDLHHAAMAWRSRFHLDDCHD